jgi:hypothetical protein
MNPRKLVAGLVGAAAIATMAISAPTASAGASGDAVVNAVVGSSNFDVLEAVLIDLGLVGTVAGLENATIFAPADASFRGFVADLTNTPIWQLSEQKVIEILKGLDDAVVTSVVAFHVAVAKDGRTYTMLDGQTITAKPFFFTNILPDKDPTDLDPFTVGRPIQAGTNTVYTIAGVLRPTELKGLFPLD